MNGDEPTEPIDPPLIWPVICETESGFASSDLAEMTLPLDS